MGYCTTIRRKIPAILVVIGTLLGTAVPAFAVGPFQDVSPGSSYTEAIRYAYDNRITIGTSADTFSPDRLITNGEMSMMFCRAFFTDKEWPMEEAISEIMRRRDGVVMQPNLHMDSRVTRGWAYKTLFACAGIPAYRPELYRIDSDVDDAIFAAANLGLCDMTADPWEYVTRAEVVQMLYLMGTGQTNPVVPPPILEEINISIEDTYAVSSGQFLQEVEKVPKSILEQFSKEDWSLVVGNKELAVWNYKNGMSASGLTIFGEKTLFVANAGSTIHEFGHFLHHHVQVPEMVKQLYEKEATQAEVLLGEYAMTNDNEYFAEVFEYWIASNGDEGRLSRLQAAAPGTYAYFAKLEANNWDMP